MGLDVELVDASAKKESNVCPHCRLILETPFQTDEGVRLCKNCLEEIKKKPEGRCSCCGQTVKEGQYYPDRAALREVNAIVVFCKHKRFGCPWKDTLKDYQSHVAGCQFAGVSCPHSGCGEMVLTRELQTHLSQCLFRLVTCSHCRTELMARNLEEHHSSECPMIPVDCSRCGERVNHRHQMEDHLLSSCRMEQCLVCQTLVDRKTSRNATTSSPDLSLSTTSTTSDVPSTGGPQPKPPGGKKSGPRAKQKQQKKAEKSSSGATVEEVIEGEEEGERQQLHLGHPATVFRHIQSLASQQDQLKTDLATFSQSAEVSTGGSRGNGEAADSVRELIGRLEDQVKLLSQQAEKERERRTELEQRLEQAVRDLERVENTARNSQREREGERTVVRATAMGKEGRSWEGGDDVESRLRMLEQRTEQQQRDTSTIKVNLSELELQLQASLASTHNGAFLWRIPEVARRRRDAIEERITSIYSPPFYSGRNGYKMCIRAYLNGDGSGYKTHFSVFFVLMRGEFDPLLKWPFEYKVSLILVDQNHKKHVVQTFKPTAESSSFKRPTSDMNVASGCPQFSKLSVLEDDSYVKDDVLYLKCIIDTSRIFHP